MTKTDVSQSSDHNCQYRMIRDTYRVEKVLYRIDVSCNIVSVHKLHDTGCVSYKSYCIVKSYVSYET